MNYYIFLGIFILQIVSLLSLFLLKKSKKLKKIRFINEIMIIFSFDILVCIYILNNAPDFF